MINKRLLSVCCAVFLFLVTACGSDSASNQNGAPATPTPIETSPTQPPTQVDEGPKFEATGAPLSDDSIQTPIADEDNFGIRFACEAGHMKYMRKEMDAQIAKYGIETSLFEIIESNDGAEVTYRLRSQPGDTNSLEISTNPTYNVTNETITFYDKSVGADVTEPAVSTKEIILAMMQRGRLFELRNERCTARALIDHIEIRKNITRWGQQANWTFPEENETSSSNPEFWNGFKVKAGKKISDAIADAWNPKQSYYMGCRIAGGLMVSQGILDYFVNIAKFPEVISGIESYVGNNPLNKAEPSVSGTTIYKEGGFTTRYFDVPWNSWIPGDWGWIKNTDDESAATNGLEGSNIVYIGRGYFAAYYGNGHDRSLETAVLRVYRWRKAEKQLKISDGEIFKLTREDPYETKDGLLRNVRDIPRNFHRLAK